MLKFTIIDFEDGDEELALIDEKGNAVISGDTYHDRIRERIEGFFRGLRYAGKEYEVIEIEREGSLYESEYC